MASCGVNTAVGSSRTGDLGGAGQGLTISGTTYSHDAVARLLSRLMLIPDLTGVTLRKAVPKKKSPTGKAIPGEKIQVPGCASKLLFSKAFKRKTDLSDLEMERELDAMRKEGVIHCANGLWWKR